MLSHRLVRTSLGIGKHADDAPVLIAKTLLAGYLYRLVFRLRLALRLLLVRQRGPVYLEDVLVVVELQPVHLLVNVYQHPQRGLVARLRNALEIQHFLYAFFRIQVEVRHEIRASLAFPERDGHLPVFFLQPFVCLILGEVSLPVAKSAQDNVLIRRFRFVTLDGVYMQPALVFTIQHLFRRFVAFHRFRIAFHP